MATGFKSVLIPRILQPVSMTALFFIVSVLGLSNLSFAQNVSYADVSKISDKGE